MKTRSRRPESLLRIESLESRALLSVVSFQDGVYPDSSYAGTGDAQMAENQPYARYGASTSLNVDGDEPASSDDDVAALLRWDISSLGNVSGVDTASITLNITNHSGGESYSIYEAKRPWIEAEASWETWASGRDGCDAFHEEFARSGPGG